MFDMSAGFASCARREAENRTQRLAIATNRLCMIVTPRSLITLPQKLCFYKKTLVTAGYAGNSSRTKYPKCLDRKWNLGRQQSYRRRLAGLPTHFEGISLGVA